jgi:hypothetical protein
MTVDSHAQGVGQGNLLSLERRCRAVMGLQDRFRDSRRGASGLASQSRNTQRLSLPVEEIEDQKLPWRIRELARRHVRWGRRWVYGRLRLAGWSVNIMRVPLIWREEGAPADPAAPAEAIPACRCWQRALAR